MVPLRNWVRYSVRSVKRHLAVAIIVGVVVTLLGGMLMVGSPPSYQTSVTVLLRTEGSVSDDGTALTLDQASRQANGVITRRDSLDRMIDDVDLVDDQVHQPIFGRISNALSDTVLGKPSDEDRRENLRRDLRQLLTAEPSPFGDSIMVSITWGDAQQAKQIADLAYTIFFEDRRVAEITPKQEEVRILTDQITAATALVAQLRTDLGLFPLQDAPQGSDLQTAIGVERDLKTSVQRAQLDLQRAQEGLQYRYALLQPAEVPPKPIDSNLPRYAALAVLVVIMTIVACLLIDRRRGRVLEQWQLDRYGLRVLATISPASADATASTPLGSSS